MDIALVIVALLLFVVGPVVVVNRDLLFNRSAAKRRQYVEPPLPFLIIPTSPDSSDIQPAGTVPWRARAPMRPSAEETAEVDEESFERPFDRLSDYQEAADNTATGRRHQLFSPMPATRGRATRIAIPTTGAMRMNGVSISGGRKESTV